VSSALWAFLSAGFSLGAVDAGYLAAYMRTP
jgi:hypothetical protein